MKTSVQTIAISCVFSLLACAPGNILRASEDATPCAEAFLTGTGGGPAPQFGNAQAGVFVRYGDTGNGCNSVRLQIDAGRGVLLKLSLVPAPAVPGFVTPQSLDALFITHAHSDHTSSLPDMLATRWTVSKNDGQFDPAPPPAGRYAPLPVICSGIACDVAQKATHMWDDTEIPLRKKSDFRLTTPHAKIERFAADDEKKMVWRRGEVAVSATAVKHIPDSVGYLIETPAGDICISGDTAVSENLVTMCAGAEVVIHDTVHPVLNAIAENPPAADPQFISVIGNIYESHAAAAALSVFEPSEATLIMTHLTPPVGAGGFQGIALKPYLDSQYDDRPAGPLAATDYCRSLRAGGFTGEAHVGVDLTAIRLTNNKVVVTPPEGKVTDCAKILAP